MAKSVNDLVLDAALDKIALADLMTVCSAQPLTAAEAMTDHDGTAGKYKIADVAVAGGDFVKAAGDTSGRKTTVAQKADVPIDVSATATHIALVDTTPGVGAEVLLYVTTCTSQALSAGGTVTIPSWDIEIADPA